MLSGQINTSSSETEGLKPAVPNGQEAPCMPSFESKHSVKSTKKEQEDAETTDIIFANAMQGDDGVWYVDVSAAIIAGIATIATGRTISDDKILSLCKISHISVLNPGWQTAGPGPTPKKPKRVIEATPGLCKRLDYQFETQKEMSEWLDWEAPNACATKKKKTSASDSDVITASISQFTIDVRSGKRVRNKKEEHLCTLPYGIPRHIHYGPGRPKPLIIVARG